MLRRIFPSIFPKDTPEEVVKAYEWATQEILKNEDCLKSLNELGQVPKFMTAEEAEQNEAKLYAQFRELQDSLDK